MRIDEFRGDIVLGSEERSRGGMLNVKRFGGDKYHINNNIV